MANPFHPTFGVSPPLLVGRDELIEEFREALEDGPGSAARATIYTGARGAGKTVMLNAIEDVAKSNGWLVISETASPGFLDRITHEHLPRLLRSIDPEAVQRRLIGLTAPLNAGAVTWTTTETHVAQLGLRSQLELLTDLLAEHETGLLITLDEIHRNQIGELRDLAVAIQHGFRENREIAFVGVGLEAAVTELLADRGATFLRRAERHKLGRVDNSDVARALKDPIVDAGRLIGEAALEVMVAGTRGYPFLIQLVGAQAWRLHPQEPEINLADAEDGVARASRRMGSLVHAPALAEASAIDKSFLVAMARDDGASKMADIQERLEVDVNYISQYRLRLLSAELIVAPRRGYVDFAIPYLREYLREHVTSEVGT